MKQQLKHLIKYTEPAINNVTLKVLSKEYRAKQVPVKSLSSNKVLVFVPHVDDETIGLGGTIKKYTSLGAEVKVVLVTDGSKSVSSLPGEELSSRRKSEMEKVQHMLEFDSIEYLTLPDGNVEISERNIQDVLNIIKDFQPDVIYTNVLVDAHLDHVNTSLLLAESLKQFNVKDSLKIYMYEINCPIPVAYINTLIDITEELPLKQETINIFASQAIDFDGFINLNIVKSNLSADRSIGAGEVFLGQEAGDFINFAEYIKNKKEDFPDIFKQANKTVTLLWAYFQNKKTKERLYKEGISYSNIQRELNDK